MILPNIIKKVRSGVLSIGFYYDDKKVSSGSGFLSDNKIISANHVFFTPTGQPISESTVKITSGNSSVIYDGKYEDFMRYLKSGSHQDNNDYAVFNFNNIPKDSYQFELEKSDDVLEGDEVIVMGFPFDLENMTTSIGIISAKYVKNTVNYLQLDVSVNAGNSGGPLVDLATLKVVGIITRKESGLDKDFDSLSESFQNNIKILKQAQESGSIGLMGINPIEFFEITQTQMLVVSNNIKRSANTGIGYAFSIDELVDQEFISKK